MKISDLNPHDSSSIIPYTKEGLVICFGDLSEKAKDMYRSFFACDFDNDDEIAGDLQSFIHEGYLIKE